MSDPIRILALGSEQEVRRALTPLVADPEFSIHQADSPAEAVRLLDAFEMDVMVVEAAMDRDALVALASDVRAISPTLQVVSLQARPLFDSWQEAADAGVFDELPATADAGVVARTVRAAVRLKEAEDEIRRLHGENERHLQHLEELVEARTRALSRSRDKLEKSQMRYQAVMRSTPHGLCLLAPDWRVDFGNHTLAMLLSPSSGATQDLGGLPLAALFPDAQSFESYTRAALQQIRRQGIDVRDVQLRRLDGTEFWCEISIVRHDPGSTHAGFVATFTDITERRRAREQLMRAAFYDPLTNLPNRRLFLDRLQEAIAHARETGDGRFALLFLDLDRFKNINDSMGHLAGDELLEMVAARLDAVRSESDVVARLGGDEFVFLVRDHGERMLEAARRIRECFAQPFVVRGQEIFVNASIGAAPYTPEYAAHEEMLRDADAAMYHAKSRGRGSIAVFDGHMHEEARTALRLETELRNALLRDEFFLEYQPILDSASREVAGFEALIRWSHPGGDVLQPSDFIRAAEESGLIIPMGEWVVREACRTLAEWNRTWPGRPGLRVAVNVSPRQFAHPDFVSSIREAFQEHGVDPSSLILEITESVITEGPEMVQAVFRRLRELGVSLFLDDFGMGYSSLSYLQRFPLDAIKIDRSFVTRIDSVTKDRDLLVAIAGVGRALRLNVLIEGIESAAILNAIQGIPYDMAQGYHFFRPMVAHEATELLAGGTP